MPDNLQSGMAQPELIGGMMIVLEALDPVTGDNVPDVVISDVVISGIPLEDTVLELGQSGPFMFVPGPGEPVAA